ncbi:hypothetical protein BGZ97_013145 [Linnemannia gamsii]|uniref:Uncharacterized protein n=1 Tax=Linnemannia gamsii TaxID=64522 RepID=A0A9P6UKY9_9FUNG|nr:hypothetical protein BGZ97_013145 [Linnemannia gamsii]
MKLDKISRLSWSVLIVILLISLSTTSNNMVSAAPTKGPKHIICIPSGPSHTPAENPIFYKRQTNDDNDNDGEEDEKVRLVKRRAAKKYFWDPISVRTPDDE